MTDIVIDTSTLVHANNPGSGYQEHSIELITRLINGNELLTVDEGFDLIESSNKSFIAREYIEHLNPGSMGYILVQLLAQNQRINFVSKEVPTSIKNYIEKIIRNKQDRIFLRVTINSSDKTLASHDYEDYQNNKRKKLKDDLKIFILDAEEVIDKL